MLFDFWEKVICLLHFSVRLPGHEVISTDDVIGVTGDKVGRDDMEEVISNTGDGECTQHFDAIGGRWVVGFACMFVTIQRSVWTSD